MSAAGPLDEIRVSVALVTRNRPDSLRRCLASLRGQSAQPFEVLVSDDSDAAFSEKTRAVADEFSCRYQPGPRSGLYANRNAAALACKGTHIRTMDDDHTFPPGHFAACLAAVKSDPAAVWTTGETGYVDGVFQGRSERATQLHPSGVGGPVADPDDNWAVADGSTIYPAAVFASGLRMVEEFGFGSAYLEFGAFLRAHGFRSRCVPDALVEHHARSADLARDDFESRLFSCLCFNLWFHRHPVAAALRIGAFVLRAPVRTMTQFPRLFQMARARWVGVPPCGSPP
jgi:glycosyltransferase involved in cell wall biosynthesis